ncbi:MAG: DUF935 family protein, partial [Alphaproteobacteria bacterium]|nr:DUF935 family protein [Alphaproteobacteria bacterium]
MVGLIDQYGMPLKRDELFEEEAGPRMATVRNIHHSYSSAGLEPQQWAQHMRQADEGDPLAYLEIAEQIEEKDPHYVGVLLQRKRAVTGLEITVESANDDDEQAKAHAQLIRDWLDRDELTSDLEDIMDAVGKGYSVCEIIWDKKTYLPARLEWRDPRWFAFDRVDGRTLKLRAEGGQLKELSRHKYIVHQVRSKSGLPVRGGVVRPVSWYWLYKNFSVRDWVVFAETYGQPIRLGKYGPGSTAADRRVLMRAVAGLGSDAGATIPDSMSIEFIKDANPT